MNEKLLAILLGWRGDLGRRGMPAPPIDDLRRIAGSGRVWPADGLDVVTEAWKPTIQYLEKQQRFGVVDPVQHMSDDEWALPEQLRTAAAAVARPPEDSARPTTARGAAGDTDRQHAVIEALRTWLAGARERSPGAVDNINEMRLRRIASTSDAQRRQVLSSYGLLAYEREINAAIAEASGNTAQPAPAMAGTAPTSASGPPPREEARAASSRTPVRPVATVNPDGFATYDFSRANEDQPVPLKVSVTAGKSLLLHWDDPADGAQVHIYRIVASDEVEPWSPESGRLVVATTDRDIEDTEPFSAAVRYLQVWCNSGASEREAKASQPSLVAQSTVVCPVIDMRLREEAGVVTGEWEVFDGIDRVQVYRVPVRYAQHGALSPQYRIQSHEDNLNGFQDDAAARGERYLYQAVAEATVDDSVQMSIPVSRELQVSAVLERVTDLTVEMIDDNAESFFDIVWTAPKTGRVTVYRSQHRPAAGIEDEVTDEARLAQANLMDEDRLAPVRRNLEPGRDGMRRVPWPSNWPRAYFTPVTRLNGQALVGKTVAMTRIPPVHDAELMERVNEQLLTFSWPAGAAAVWAFKKRRHTEATVLDPATDHPDFEISREIWQSQGGYHIVPPLPVEGCALHLCAVAFQDGQTYRSAPTTLDYPGLRIIRYAVNQRRGKLTLSMSLATPGVMPTVDFALVANRERLPLDIKDGTIVPLAANTEGSQPQPMITPQWAGAVPVQGGWNADLTWPAGRYYIRLFAALDAQLLSRLALLDPPISTLVLDRT